MKRLLVVLAACGGTPAHSEPPPAPPPIAPTPVVTTPVTPPTSGPPVAAIHVVKNTYHGVSVDDPYQWLEADNADTKTWSDAQNTYARGVLEKLPDVAVFRAELDKIINAPITTYGDPKPAGGKLFMRRKQPNKQQAELVVLPNPEHAAKATLVFDPVTADHPKRAIDWFVPSPDGTKVAIAASDNGSEVADLRIIALDGKELEVVANVQRATAGGDAAWTADGKGIYYTRYPAPGEKPDSERDFWQQVWFHKLGTTQDRYELGKDFPKNAEILLDTDSRGRVIASVQEGDGGRFRHYLRDAKGAWRQLDDWADKIVGVRFGATADLWVVSRHDAPRGKVLRLAADAKSANDAKLVVPEGKDAIVTDYYSEQDILAIGDRIVLTYQLGGPTEVRAFTTAGKPDKAPQGPPVSSVGKPAAWYGELLVEYESFTTQPTWHRFDVKSGAQSELAELSPHRPVDLSSLEVRREMATSKDGTQVPVNILWPKGAPQDGSVPCVVSGYGGFAISQGPGFAASFAPLLTRGTCLVQVNLRGGGEFGEDWHRDGMLLKKQNVFDDFAAALEYVKAQKYTSTAHVAILGGSNGGLLMGAMIAQHPQAMKAVISSVGIYDMLRNELTTNGQFNVSEYGSVTDEAQFAALHAYSPYHHVARTAYPAIFMHTGANDGRVAPWQSRKMIAALQAANTGSAPILLHTTDSGHGMGTGTAERIDNLALEFAFLRAELK